MSWFKKNLSNIIITFCLILGLSLLIYPSFSDYWNSLYQSKAISNYNELIKEIDDHDYKEILDEARKYNALITSSTQDWTLSQKELDIYNSLLNVNGNGIMGYIEIPKIRSQLSIYHGVSDEVLQVAVGHIEGSSLPVGGKGTHSVISGHRGLPSAKLFTNIDQLTTGDIFMIRILDEVLTYEVDLISIVDPDDISLLQIDDEKDYVTLVTCTPYGINTHRLLVRGHRIDNIDHKSIFITSEALQVDPILVAPIIASPILLVLMLLLFFSNKHNKNTR